jgi:putative heme-binding domain-containing protein
MEVIETTDGRVVTGLVVEEGDNAISIQTANEKVVIPAGEIERRSESGVSMMPEGLIQQLSPSEVRDLFAYLTGADQSRPAVENRAGVKPAAPPPRERNRQ